MIKLTIGALPALFACALPVLLNAAGHAPRQAQVLEQYGQIPLYFEPNLGQTDGHVKFLARSGGYTLFLTAGEAVMALSRGAAPNVVRMKLENADLHAPVSGLERQPGISAYFIGNDPSKWRPEVPHYARVEYKGVYPGVDLIYYGTQREVEYDFVVRPGADPGRIRLAYQGVDGLRVDDAGDLVLTTASGDIKQRKPRVWQQAGGKRVEVAASYRLHGTKVGIELAGYDRDLPLVIDPVLSLVYSTYLGGSGTDQANRLAVDTTGAAYVTGTTTSVDFPTANASQPTLHSSNGNAFVTKLNAYNGTGPVTLAYSTYLGGSSTALFGDTASGIAVDPAGAAYVTGFASSTDFPVVNAYQAVSHSPNGNPFVTKLNPFSGSGPVTLGYSTYLGGSHNGDNANGIAVDPSGAAYVAGATSSTDFPVANAYQATFTVSLFGNSNWFVTKFNAYSGSGPVTLGYSTYLGGTGSLSCGDSAFGIAADASGAAYVTGTVCSSDFPTAHPYQPNLGPPAKIPFLPHTNAFVVKLNPYNSTGKVTLAYSTYLGGVYSDYGRSIAVDSSGAAYVVGDTNSPDFPTANAYQPSLSNASRDAFVTKLNPYTGSGTVTLAYSTFLGGTSTNQRALDVGIDALGAAYVLGATTAPDFPLLNAYQTTPGGSFLTKFNAYSGSGPVTLAYSTYTHGAAGIAVDSAGEPYLAGDVAAPDAAGLPVANAYQSSLRGTVNAFVTKFSSGLTSPPFGFFDTPVDMASVAGAIAVTGWALDAEQIPTVDIWRDPVSGEATQSNGLVFLGNATFVNGARPDVAAAYSSYPNNTAAGWGLQLLTNELPSGNGTFRIHAIAHNSAYSAELGVKTITVNNATSLLPFGTIDTPAQGATVSGNAYVNFGWALTPQSSTIPTDGSTIFVNIDGFAIGHPVYNQPRSDIQTLFPGYQNTNGAVGYFTLDTTKLTNGLHTISWTVTDNNGHAQGIGSRYFTVQN